MWEFHYQISFAEPSFSNSKDSWRQRIYWRLIDSLLTILRAFNSVKLYVDPCSQSDCLLSVTDRSSINGFEFVTCAVVLTTRHYWHRLNCLLSEWCPISYSWVQNLLCVHRVWFDGYPRSIFKLLTLRQQRLDNFTKTGRHLLSVYLPSLVQMSISDECVLETLLVFPLYHTLPYTTINQ